MRLILQLLSIGLWLLLCSFASAKEVRLYTQRHYPADKQFFAQFTKDTGIEVKVIKAGANELLARLKAEKAAPQADLFITTDAAALDRADAAGLLDKLNSEKSRAGSPKASREKMAPGFPSQCVDG